MAGVSVFSTPLIYRNENSTAVRAKASQKTWEHLNLYVGLLHSFHSDLDNIRDGVDSG